MKSHPLANKILGLANKTSFAGANFTLPTWNKNYPLFSVLLAKSTKLHLTCKSTKWHLTCMMCCADFLKRCIWLKCRSCHRSCQGQAAETQIASFALLGEKTNFWRTSLVGFDSLYQKLKLFVNEFSERFILKLGTNGTRFIYLLNPFWTFHLNIYYFDFRSCVLDAQEV